MDVLRGLLLIGLLMPALQVAGEDSPSTISESHAPYVEIQFRDGRAAVRGHLLKFKDGVIEVRDSSGKPSQENASQIAAVSFVAPPTPLKPADNPPKMTNEQTLDETGGIRREGLRKRMFESIQAARHESSQGKLEAYIAALESKLKMADNPAVAMDSITGLMGAYHIQKSIPVFWTVPLINERLKAMGNEKVKDVVSKYLRDIAARPGVLKEDRAEPDK